MCGMKAHGDSEFIIVFMRHAKYSEEGSASMRWWGRDKSLLDYIDVAFAIRDNPNISIQGSKTRILGSRSNRSLNGVGDLKEKIEAWCPFQTLLGLRRCGWGQGGKDFDGAHKLYKSHYSIFVDVAQRSSI